MHVAALARPRAWSCDPTSVRGAGGRSALERYSDRVDAMLRQLFAEAAAPSDGGRRARARRLRPAPPLPPLRHRSAGALRRPHRRRREFLRAFLHPLWDLGVVVGHQVRELDDFRARDGQPRVPAGAARRAAGGRLRRCSTVSARCFTRRRRTHILEVAAGADRRAPRAVQRHAVSARARREGSARARCATSRRRGRSPC